MSVGSIGSFYSGATNGHYGTVASRQVVGQLADGTDVVHVKVRQGAGQVGGATGSEDTVSHAPGAVRGEQQLTPAERAEVARLRQRDAAVRREEEAHAAAAGQFGGPPQYTYTRGPDGRLYATGGSVSIKSTSTGDPDEARKIASRIAAAATAPVRPSSADFAAAASAYHLAAKAQGGGQEQGPNPLDLLA